MSYQKQGFYSGGDLYASQLEAMEDGIINAERLAMEGASGAANMEKGTGENATQQIPRTDKVTQTEGEEILHFNFTGHPDAGMAGRIQYGAVGNYSASINGRSAALNKHAFAINNSTVAKGEESFAQGYETIAEGNGSSAMGSRTWAEGTHSHTEGEGAHAKGKNSHAEGYETKANGEAAHAEGVRCEATGDHSHAEGTDTKASGIYSHAEGRGTEAEGTDSHAEGYCTLATGTASHAGGYETKAGYGYQTVVGIWNDNQTNTLFEVGNGHSEENGDIVRSNGFSVYKDGDIGIYKDGKIYSLHKMLAAYFTDANLK